MIDVRSPGEYEQGHIPGAVNVPLFDNEERARIGTLYVQTGREEAIRLGYEVATPKIKSFIKKTEELFRHAQPDIQKTESGTMGQKSQTVLVHCWRGGMRSSKFAQMLNEHGYRTHTLVKGYKAYRQLVLESFNDPIDILILGGETGSGKTEILKHIASKGEQVIDLEALAHHKGSAFGSLGEKPQPTYEHFENELWYAFSKMDLSKRIWMEDESRNIGRTQIPMALWDRMKKAPIFRVSIPKTSRIERLLNDYGSFSKEDLKECILKIQQRLGPQHVKHALEELEKGNLHEVADIALTYYDKSYNYNHEKRLAKNIYQIECSSADAADNAAKILEFAKMKTKPTHV